MNLVYGDLWDEIGRADLILVTTNSYVNKRGELVMGRGAAKEAVSHFPRLPYFLGEAIQSSCEHLGDYGVIFVVRELLESIVEIGAFQVKRHYRDKADPKLIAFSTDRLLQRLWRYDRVAMNYPGIGYGGLPIQEVEPIIQSLPDSVFVYRRENEAHGV